MYMVLFERWQSLGGSLSVVNLTLIVTPRVMSAATSFLVQKGRSSKLIGISSRNDHCDPRVSRVAV